MSASLNPDPSVSRLFRRGLAGGLLLSGGVLALVGLSSCGNSDSGAGAGSPPGVSPFQSASNPTGSVAASATQIPAECLPGAARCGGPQQLQTCNPQGNAFNVTSCEGTTTCLGGACRQLSCSAGETLCLGAEIHTCNSDGKSTTLKSTCPTGQACQSSTKTCAPQLCPPLEAACNGNVATHCDATGFAFDTSAQTDCGAQTCNAGACRAPEGVSSTPLSPSQSATTPDPTQTATTTASPTQACVPSALSCNSANVARTCSADGSSFTDTRCPDGTVCQGAGQCMPVKCDPSKLLSHNGNGQVTVYWFAQGTLASPPQAGQDVNCSFNASRANNDDGGQNDKVAYIQDPALFGAMNLSEYNGAATCGACVAMTQGGRSVTLTIADSCNPAINNNGSCTSGHIDMSRNAFQQLTGQSTGNIGGISWKVVPCDHVGKVQFLLKKPDDMYWNQFLVLNHRYPIVKAEVLMKDGRWVQATRETYNYWLPPEGAGPGGDMGTYRVRVTDVNGAIIEEQLALQGGLQGGNGQFDCQP